MGWPAPGPVDGLRLIPAPVDWAPSGGTCAVAGLAATHPVFDAVAAMADRTGLGPLRTPRGDDIPVTLAQADLPTDAYRLTVAPDFVRLF